MVTRSSMPDYDEYCQEIKELWATRWLTNNGVKHNRLQNALCDYLGVAHTVLYTNGHLALENAFAAMGLRGEVITTPFTFASTTNAIVRCGLTPVFCDIKPTDFTLDPDKIEACVTPQTCAIVPVHVYGNVCDYRAIDAIAKRHNLRVIYDAAHAFGVSKAGVNTANMGDASMYSFHATKVFNTIEGGALCFADDALVSRLNMTKNFGLCADGDVAVAGGNAKMNEFQAAMGLCNLRHLPQQIALRKRVYQQYMRCLSGLEGVQLPVVPDDVEGNYAYFPVLFGHYKYTRDQVFDRLAQQGIMARKYFYPTTNSFAYLADMPHIDRGHTPIADYVAQNILCLPMYADLAPEDVQEICDIICR